MKILILDTETAGTLSDPFIYNIGYIVAELETKEVLAEKEFIVEQVWHDRLIMAGKHHAKKKPFYEKGLKGRAIKLDKFGYILQHIARDIKKYKIDRVYAFNSSFDERAIEYDCDFFNCINPFETFQFLDILKLFKMSRLYDEKFKAFCTNNNLLTPKKKASTTAETIYKYIHNDINFIQSHTALADVKIEYEILKAILDTAEKD